MSIPNQPGTLVEVWYKEAWRNGRVCGQEKTGRITVGFVVAADELGVKHYAMDSSDIRLQREEKGESQCHRSGYVSNASMGTITSEPGNKVSLRHAPAQHLDNPLEEDLKRPSASRQSSGTVQLGKCTTERDKKSSLRRTSSKQLDITAQEYLAAKHLERAAAAGEYSEVSEVLRPSSQKDVPSSRRSREVKETSDTEEEHDPEVLYWNEKTGQLDSMTSLKYNHLKSSPIARIHRYDH